MTRLFRGIVPALLFVAVLAGCYGEAESAGASEGSAVGAFTISGPGNVADLALRGEDFGSWNYGREIFLEAGYFVGLYDVHHGASLVRFNVTGIPANTVASAKFRIYKPRSMSQQGPVKVHVFRVSKENGDWVEGGSASAEEPGASCWQLKANGKSWAGAAGCSKPGIDYETPALDAAQTVTPATSGWLEFDLPKELVQSWLDNPHNNTGLYIASQENPNLADEAHFYSSQHPSGKGPQLIIEATKGAPKSPRQEWPWNPPEFLPPADCKELAQWKKDASGRYHTWATGPEMNLSKEQSVWPYYWDIYVRANLTSGQCYLPLASSLARLEKFVAEKNEDALLAELNKARVLLLKYEDVKSMHIHQAGPVAEILSSRQLGTMLGAEGFGVHARDGVKKYAPKSAEAIDASIKKEIAKYKEEWDLSDEQAAIMTPYIQDYEGKKWQYSNETGKWMRKVQELLAEGKDNEELFDAARQLFFNHKMYVYWLSDFNTPKWKLWLNIVKAPPASIATEFINARDDQYVTEKLDDQLRELRAYYWYPPILYVNPVDKDVTPNGFGSRAWPFTNVQEAVKAASDGTEIRVAGGIDKASIDLLGKKVIISDGYNSTFNMKSQTAVSKSANSVPRMEEEKDKTDDVAGAPDAAKSQGKKTKDKTDKKNKPDKKTDPAEIAKKAEKKKNEAVKALDPAENLKLLNQWGERPAAIQNLYTAAYKAFVAKPSATYTDLAHDAEVQRLCAGNGVTHWGGPMLGTVAPDGARVWIRTLRPAKVEVRVTVDGAEKTYGPVQSAPETDLAAIVPVTGLKPGTRNPYRVLVDGKPIAIPEQASINTPPGDKEPAKVRITFGTCFHRWGLGNQKQADMIRSREPAAMLLYGDITVQDRNNNFALHRADYLLRDFFPAWQSLVATVPVYATWDDHDYFDNDKWGIPEGYAKMDQKGVWEVFRNAWNNPSYGFGDERRGVFLRTRVGPCDVIMTDERYFRAAPGKEGCFLGEDQMKWLEAQLLDCKGPFIILSNGTMWSDYVSNGKDSWGVYDPKGRERVFDLIEKNRIGGVLLISGDRHGARGFRIPRPSGYDFYEFEAGSLGGRTGPAPTNPEWDTQFYGISGKYAFGEFSIDATVADPEVTFRLVGSDDGAVIHEMKLTRSQLTPPGN